MAAHEPATSVDAGPVATTAVPIAPGPTLAPSSPDPAVFPFAGLTANPADGTPESFDAGGGTGFSLERHAQGRRPGNGPLDWAALVLAIIVPPLGLIVAIVAVIVGSRSRGFAAGIAKVAIAIAILFSLGAGIGAVVLAKTAGDQAAHNAVVASSAAWCTSLKSDPATLASSTYGWPEPADTIPDSITSMQAYVDKWTKLESIAPSGIKTGTGTIAATAKSIVSGVTSTQSLDDSTDISEMQNAVSTSGVGSWVANYCN